jgi:cell fate (sporulation/competence/biofilm development) regulator YlbF (YheA/YmcA/DUF963 family)
MDCDLKKGEVNMAVNLYDTAYALEQAIRESEEYTRLQTAYKEVYADASTKEMFEKFREIQMKLQDKQMMGEEITQEELEQAQATVSLVQQNEKISNLMEAEQKMSVVIADLNQIIMKPLEELYGAADNK